MKMLEKLTKNFKQMKLVFVINQELKMSKGKIARICGGLGMELALKGIKYPLFSSKKGIACKTNDINTLISKLVKHNIDIVTHIDAGHTEVDYGSMCGIAFLVEENKYDFVEELKLL